jgi:hypothetical protein
MAGGTVVYEYDNRARKQVSVYPLDSEAVV